MKKIISAIIGCGEFSANVIIPCLEKTGRFKIKAGLIHNPNRIPEVEKKFSLEYATMDYAKILKDDDIQCVFIASRHDNRVIPGGSPTVRNFAFLPTHISLNAAQEGRRVTTPRCTSRSGRRGNQKKINH